MFSWKINGWILKEWFGESQAGGLNGLNDIMAFILTRCTRVLAKLARMSKRERDEIMNKLVKMEDPS